MATFIEDMRSAFIWEKRDMRLENWPMMSSVWPTLLLGMAYVLFSYVIGPWIMRDRKPYNFKSLIIIYNIVQVIGCCYVFVEMGKIVLFGQNNNWRKKIFIIKGIVTLPFIFKMLAQIKVI